MEDKDSSNVVHIYIKELNAELKKLPDTDTEAMFVKLNGLEIAFSKKLKTTADGKRVYDKFIEKINHTKGGIKMARAYFRGREDTFTATVGEAISKRKPQLMYAVPINYKFVLFAVQNVTRPHKRLHALYEKIKVAREEIINKYLHLALNRAKVFTKSSYKGYSEFGDILQLSNEALVLAVDKYVLDENSSSFHAMAIGRMLANLIANSFSPSSATIGLHNQKKLYKIRKLKQTRPDLRNKEIAEILELTEKEVDELVEATKYSSLDQPLNTEDADELLGDYTADPNSEFVNPHVNTESNELLNVLYSNLDKLNVIEQKVLKLKGVKTCF
jgi:RNA polymerase sigma factor (sigma-70 family)